MDKALLVGINQFKNVSGLNGCVNDNLRVADIAAKHYNFPAENIRMLLDSRATKAAIMESLAWLVDCQPDDRILFACSSHGTQTASRAGSGEVDGLDEVFCPHDFEWSPDKYISDKEFYSIFSKMPKGVRFQWICDTCHSGDMTRALGPVFATKKPVMIPRFLPPPPDIQWEINVARSKSIATAREDKSLEVGFVSGCRSSQTSADTFIDGQYCGAMTYYFTKNLLANPEFPMSKIVELANKDLKANGYSQEPQVEGTRSNVAFFGKLETPPAPVEKKKSWFFC